MTKRTLKRRKKNFQDKRRRLWEIKAKEEFNDYEYNGSYKTKYDCGGTFYSTFTSSFRMCLKLLQQIFFEVQLEKIYTRDIYRLSPEHSGHSYIISDDVVDSTAKAQLNNENI